MKYILLSLLSFLLTRRLHRCALHLIYNKVIYVPKPNRHAFATLLRIHYKEYEIT